MYVSSKSSLSIIQLCLFGDEYLQGGNILIAYLGRWWRAQTFGHQHINNGEFDDFFSQTWTGAIATRTSITSLHFFTLVYRSLCSSNNLYPLIQPFIIFLQMKDPGGIANWSVTYVDWSEMKWHPKAFRAKDISYELLKNITVKWRKYLPCITPLLLLNFSHLMTLALISLFSWLMTICIIQVMKRYIHFFLELSCLLLLCSFLWKKNIDWFSFTASENNTTRSLHLEWDEEALLFIC